MPVVALVSQSGDSFMRMLLEAQRRSCSSSSVWVVSLV